jgi:hypothetical protein
MTTTPKYICLYFFIQIYIYKNLKDLSSEMKIVFIRWNLFFLFMHFLFYFDKTFNILLTICLFEQ